MTESNPYLQILRQDSEGAMRQALLTAVDRQPDAEARLQGLARQYGLPVEAVRLDAGTVERRAKLDALPYDEIIRSMPATAQLLSDPRQAAIAHDDVENLGGLETLLNSFRRGVPALRSVSPALQAFNQASGLHQLDDIDSALAAGENLDGRRLGVLGEAYAGLRTAEERARFRDFYQPKAEHALSGAVGALADFQAERQAITEPGVVNDVLSAGDFGGAFRAFRQDPLRFLAAVGPESLVQSAPGLLAAIPAAIYGGPLGVAGVVGANSSLVDYAGELVGNLQNAGVDVRDPAAIRAALADPDTLASLTEQAGKHAGMVGLFDAVSGGLAGKMLLPQAVGAQLVGRPLAREMAKIAAQLPVQAGLGAAGEAAGELAAGQAIQPGQVLAEGVGELFGAPVEVAAASARRVHEGLQHTDSTEQMAGNALGQTGFIHLTGEEIAPLDLAIQDLREAAKRYFENTILNNSIIHPVLGEIQLTNRGLKKALSSSANPLKLRLFAALPELLAHGDLVRSQDNVYSDKQPNIKRYHWLRGNVMIGDKPVSVEVNVEEHTDGKLYYNHTSPGQEYFQSGAQARSPSIPGVVSAAEHHGAAEERPAEAIGSEPSGNNLAHSADDINLAVGALAQNAGEKPDSGDTGQGLEQAFGELFGSPAAAILVAARRMSEQLRQAESAEQTAAGIERLNGLAAASKVLRRSPELVKAFVSSVLQRGGGPDAGVKSGAGLGDGNQTSGGHVYIDAKALLESGVAEQVFTALPEMAEQMPAALVSGGEIGISLADYVTKIAPTAFAPALLEHSRLEGERFNRAQAREHLAGREAALRAEVERVLKLSAADEALHREILEIKQAMQDQLDRTGRFGVKVNRRYAELTAHFYATQAERFGVSPSELWRRYPLRVVAGAGEGRAFGQILPEAMPDGMALGDGAKAAAMYRGEDKTKAVLLNGLVGDLVKDALVAGVKLGAFSHSIDQSALNHIRNEHGNDTVASELERGQLPILDSDIEAIPDIVEHYDAVRFDLVNKLGRPMVAYAKNKPTGAFLYFEEVRNKRRDLAAHAMRKYPATSDAADILRNVPLYVRNDGGHSGIISDGENEDKILNQSNRVDEDSIGDSASPDRLERHPTTTNARQVLKSAADGLNVRNDGGHGKTIERSSAGVNQQNFHLREAATFDEARLAAKAFQSRPLTNAETGMVAMVSRNTLDKMLNGKAVGKSETPELHALAVANLDYLFESAIDGWSKPDRDGNENLSAIHRFFSVLPAKPGSRFVKITVKEFVDPEKGNRIYSVEAVELGDKTPAAQWVDASAEADGLDLTSIRSAGALLRLAQRVEDVNRPYRQESMAAFKVENAIASDDPSLGAVGVGGQVDLPRPPGDGVHDSIDQWLARVKQDVAGRYPQSYRGEYDPFSRTISLNPNADLSTFLHESAHFFLDMQFELAAQLQQEESEAAGRGQAFYQKAGKQAGPVKTPGDFSEADLAALTNNDLPPGEYATKTKFIVENVRHLGTDRIRSAADAAQAMAFLSRYAAERFEGLVTDSYGKPLAIIGNLKGHRGASPFFPETIAAEAFRVQGAANIWFVHNHPGGYHGLSFPDRTANGRLSDVFYGSKIRMRGLLAIAGEKNGGRFWAYAPGHEELYREARGHNPQSGDLVGYTRPPVKTLSVPILDLAYADESALGWAVFDEPLTDEDRVRLARGQSGVLLLDHGSHYNAYVPILEKTARNLRRPGRLDEWHRAVSYSNSHYAYIVNFGDLTLIAMENLMAFFNSLNIRVLDGLLVGESGIGSFRESEQLGPLFHAAEKIKTFKQSWPKAQGDGPSAASRPIPQGGLADFAADGRRQLLADTQILLDWFGVESLAEWRRLDFEEKRRHHERFAEAFEAYLLEGKAPSAALRGLFARFKAWLLQVYRTLRAKAVDLHQEVRGVFDRMLAGADEIWAQERDAQYQPLFSSAAQARMSAAEFAAYRSVLQAARMAAVNEMSRKALADMQWLQPGRNRLLRAAQLKHRALRRVARQQARSEVSALPLYRAWDFLSRRQGGGKLDAGLAARIGPEASGRLRALGMAATEGGLHPDAVAEMFGLSSGDEMLRALAAAEQPHDLVRRLTDEKLLREHGELSSAEGARAAAERALHGDLRIEAVRMEADALALACGEMRLLDGAAQRQAAAMLRQVKLADLRPRQYIRAEARAAQAAAQALAAGDLQKAAVAKREQLINLCAAREAFSRMDEIAAGVGYLHGLAGGNASLNKADMGQITALLDRFGLLRAGYQAAIPDRSLPEWLQAARGRGLAPDIAPELLRGDYRLPYRDLRIGEFRGLLAAVRQIEHLGRNRGRVLGAWPQRRMREVRGAVLADLRKSGVSV